MRRILKNLTVVVLVLLAIVVVLTATRSILDVSQDTVLHVADLRRQLDSVRDLEFEKRFELETALLQYETDNRIKVWTAIIQAAGDALNRISNDSPKDYWPIADVLTAYVRYNAPWGPSSPEAHEPTPSADIQAILTVLGHSDPPKGFNEREKLDLRKTDLRGAEFWDARLRWTDFWGAHLDGAKFWGADLRHAKFDHAHLAGANLRAAKLEGASLEGADLTGAVFDKDTVWPTGFDARGRGAVLLEGPG